MLRLYVNTYNIQVYNTAKKIKNNLKIFFQIYISRGCELFERMDLINSIVQQ